MQQVIQPIDGQATEVAEVPVPLCGPGQVLIANHATLISAGTERSTVHLAQKSLVAKARQRPDHVKRVLTKLRQEGIGNTVRQVQAKLAQPMPLGYCGAGVVLEVGAGVRDLKAGVRVANNGPHAGVVAVDRNLVAKIPDGVPYDQACYAVLGAIALQGVRLSRAGLGEVVAVVGLGLIGQMSVALLKAAGCTVVGTDLAADKRELARDFGADVVCGGDELTAAVGARSGGQGADAVLICASTSQNGPIERAAAACRKKGRIVAVGAVGMQIPRREFYPKELEFVVSCSYGPGRYDADYEQHGRDYPYAYVRWTEQRNIAAVLEQIAAGRLPVDRLTTHRFPIERAMEAYELIESGDQPHVGIVVEYPATGDLERRLPLPAAAKPAKPAVATGTPVFGISFVGAGGFASSTLLPAFAKHPQTKLRGIVSAGGLSGTSLGKRHGFAFSATDIGEVLADPDTHAVVIATRHHQHADMAAAALRAGKAVFCEKPLAVSDEQLDELRDCINDLGDRCPVWTIGFNRRFSPSAVVLREAFAGVSGPKTVSVRFNAGAIPADHWVQDPEVGGGRIVGEACHAVDLATCLIGSLPTNVHAVAIEPPAGTPATDDSAFLTLRYADGSIASIHYTAVGDRAAGKERVEMFGGGRTGVLDDFRNATVHAGGRKSRQRTWSQQKGFAEEIAAFLTALETGAFPIPPAELLATTAACLRAVQSLRLEMPLDVPSY